MACLEPARPHRAPRHIRNPIAAALAVLATATVLSGTPARAGTEVSVNPEGFGAFGFDVISENGTSWTKIVDKNFHVSVKIGIGRTDEQVVGYILRQPGQPGTYLDSWLLKSSFNHLPKARVDAVLVAQGSTTHFSAAERQQVLDLCNSRLKIGNGINQTHNVFHLAKMQLYGFFTSDPGPGIANAGGQAGQVGNGHSLVPVACKGLSPSRPGGIAAEQPANLNVSSIELFRSTYTGAVTQPNPGTECKKARWLVRMTTNKAGPVKFKLWLQKGDGPITSKVVDAWSAFDGNSGYKAEYTEWTEVNKTSVVQGMAEDMTNAFGQSTGWKEITLQCNGAGGGGLADPGGMLPPTVTGDLTLADAGPKDQPRQGQAVFKIWSSKPGNTAYKLTCTGGREWTGSLPTFKVGDEKYQAVGAHNFNVDKTEQIGCALRSTSVPKDPVIALATRLYEVTKRNPDVAGPGDITIPPRPRDDAAPQRLVATDGNSAPQSQPQQLTCVGGQSTGTACICPDRTKKVETGPMHFVCTMGDLVAKVPTANSAPPSSVPVQPTGKTTPPSLPPRLVCIGGKSTGTACFCPARTVKVQTGPNRFICQMGSAAIGAQQAPQARPRLIAPNVQPGGLVAPKGAFRPGQRESALGARRVMR